MRAAKTALRLITATSAAVKTGGPSGEPRSSAAAGSDRAGKAIARAARWLRDMISGSFVGAVSQVTGAASENLFEHPVRAPEQHAIRALLAMQELRLRAGDRDFTASLRRHNEHQQPREVRLVKRARAVAPNLSQPPHRVRREHCVK